MIADYLCFHVRCTVAYYTRTHGFIQQNPGVIMYMYLQPSYTHTKTREKGMIVRFACCTIIQVQCHRPDFTVDKYVYSIQCSIVLLGDC